MRYELDKHIYRLTGEQDTAYTYSKTRAVKFLSTGTFAREGQIAFAAQPRLNLNRIFQNHVVWRNKGCFKEEYYQEYTITNSYTNVYSRGKCNTEHSSFSCSRVGSSPKHVNRSVRLVPDIMKIRVICMSPSCLESEQDFESIGVGFFHDWYDSNFRNQ